MNTLIKKTYSNIKNIPGWKTKRKIIIFSVDDFGNIRIASNEARKNLGIAGLNINDSRFDQFDGLEKAEDLSMLFDVLTSVKDLNGNFAVFTPYTNIANIDFEGVINNNYQTYKYELLPTTLKKLPGYEGTWELWKQGIENNIFCPQFHGREHINVKIFNELLQQKNPLLLACLNNRSYTGLPLTFYKTINYNETYCFDSFDENEELKIQIKDGLTQFENIFGYKASNFTSPGAYQNEILDKTFYDYGIKFIDAVFMKKTHQGKGIYNNQIIYWGKRKNNLTYFLRNAVFEPTLLEYDDNVNSCLKEIETAFFWGKPANISSHRVNFSGVLDINNRKKGLSSLKNLLTAITKRWPDAEFMSASELGNLISKNNFNL